MAPKQAMGMASCSICLWVWLVDPAAEAMEFPIMLPANNSGVSIDD